MSFIVSEIVLIFASDGQEMDEYLSEELSQMFEYPLSITHKRIEDIDDNFDNMVNAIHKSNAIIVIMSKEFLNIIYILSKKIFHLTKHFNSKKTLIMFCECSESDLSQIHRSLLCGYRLYHKLVATVSDVKQFMLNTIKCLLNILQINGLNRHKICTKKRNTVSNSPQFELSSEKLYEAKEKIYILLDSAVSESQRIHLSVGVSNDILTVNWKNPFTLSFTIPEFMIAFNEYLEISLIAGHKHLGTRRIRCMKNSPNDSNNNTNNSIYCIERRNQTNFKCFVTDFDNEIEVKSKPQPKERKIFLNRDDYYLIPDSEVLREKTKRLSQILSTRSLDRKEFERKYSLYDIPRYSSLNMLSGIDRQVFV